MSNIEDGGPAFPSDDKYDDGRYCFGHPGMSLRDWFAGQALAGICASSLIDSHAGTNETDGEFCAGIGRRAYMYADAMLAARSKITSEPEDKP